MDIEIDSDSDRPLSFESNSDVEDEPSLTEKCQDQVNQDDNYQDSIVQPERYKESEPEQWRMEQKEDKDLQHSYNSEKIWGKTENMIVQGDQVIKKRTNLEGLPSKVCYENTGNMNSQDPQIIVPFNNYEKSQSKEKEDKEGIKLLSPYDIGAKTQDKKNKKKKKEEKVQQKKQINHKQVEGRSDDISQKEQPRKCYCPGQSCYSRKCRCTKQGKWCTENCLCVIQKRCKQIKTTY